MTRKPTARERMRAKKSKSGPKASSPKANLEVPVNLPTLAEIREGDGAANYILGARQRLSVLTAGHRERVRSELAGVYGVALILRADEDTWLKYIANAEWNGVNQRPTAKDRGDALRYAVRLAVGTSGAAASKKYHRYYRALKLLFDQEVPPELVPARIKSGKGFSKMAAAYLAEQRGNLPDDEDGRREETGKRLRTGKTRLREDDSHILVMVPLREDARHLAGMREWHDATVYFRAASNDGNCIFAENVTVSLTDMRDPRMIPRLPCNTSTRTSNLSDSSMGKGKR